MTISCRIDKRALIVFSIALIAFFVSVYIVRGYQKARFHAQTNMCRNVLRRIDSAKEQYAYPKGITNGPVAMADMEPFLGGKPITCPQGARIEINDIGRSPKCTLHGGLEGGADIRDFRFPWYPFRKNDWLYIAIYFTVIVIWILFSIKKRRQRVWSADSVIYSLVAIGLAIATLALRDTNEIRRIGREEWLRASLGDMKSFQPKRFSNQKRLRDDIEGAECLKLKDGWVYIVTHSWHSDQDIGDVVLCKDNKGNMYYADAHPCTGIILSRNAIEGSLSLKEFLAQVPEPATEDCKSWQILPCNPDEAVKIMLNVK